MKKIQSTLTSLFLVATSLFIFNACNFEDPPTKATEHIEAVQVGSHIILQWDAVPEARSYRVYSSRNSSGPFELIGEPSTTNFTDQNPFHGANFYKISAANAGGFGPQSSIFSMMFMRTPNITSVRVVGSRIEINWASVPGANNFRVFRSANAAGPFTYMATRTVHWFDDLEPLSGNNHYRIVAINNTGESAPSPVVFVNF